MGRESVTALAQTPPGMRWVNIRGKPVLVKDRGGKRERLTRPQIRARKEAEETEKLFHSLAEDAETAMELVRVELYGGGGQEPDVPPRTKKRLEKVAIKLESIMNRALAASEAARVKLHSPKKTR